MNKILENIPASISDINAEQETIVAYTQGISDTRHGKGAAATADRSGWKKLTRQGAAFLSRLMLICLVAAMIVVVAGFVIFTARMNALASNSASQNADGIVAFTGGAARLETAYRLFDEGRARRLLISGVHKNTSHAAILNSIDRSPGKTKCCVDLDHIALDTRGNAKQTRLWAKKHGFDKLIIVTSDYHLPRSLLEIGNTAPDLELIAQPALPEKSPSNDRTERMHHLLKEYAKWLAATARIRFSGLVDG